jgi:two-component system chemotaxis response regulator CheB
MTQHDIIAIGGSAGSIEALERVVPNLPADLSAAVFVVVHLASDTRSMLARVIGAAARLPTLQATAGAAVEEGRIYVAPPGAHLLIEPDGMYLGHGPRENMARPAIDALFRSAAASFGPRVIAVVLSGELNDGTAGLEAVKRCGGIAVVQDPGDALAPSMPRSALSQVAVDYCVPANALGTLLARLATMPIGEAPPVPTDIRLEVKIAAGLGSSTGEIKELGMPSPFTCPQCHGVLSEIDGKPLRFRCQIGHAFTAQALSRTQSDATEEALHVALRIIHERTALMARMAQDERDAGRSRTATMYGSRADEYRKYCDTLRGALAQGLGLPEGDEEVEAAVS